MSIPCLKGRRECKIFQDKFYPSLLSRRNISMFRRALSDHYSLCAINEIINHAEKMNIKKFVLPYTTTENHMHSSNTHTKKKIHYRSLS